MEKNKTGKKVDKDSIVSFADVLRKQRGALDQPQIRVDYDLNELIRLLGGYYLLEVQSRYMDLQWDNATMSHIEDLARFLINPDAFGVFACGTCGNGKTTLLYAFRQTVNILHRAGYFRHLGGFWKPNFEIYTAEEVCDIAKEDSKKLNRLRTLNMLGIDDMGIEPVEARSYGNVMTPVVRLIHERYKRRLFTFVTSNLGPKDIRPRYGDQTADRMNEMFHKIIFQNESYRHK